ncbi:hypothetical protein, partial [Sphingobacterium sp. UBA7625]
MAKSAKIQSPKKELKNKVITHLQDTISYLRDHFSEKEFSNRIEKAAKLLIEGLKNKTLAKNNSTAAKTQPEATPKKTAAAPAAKTTIAENTVIKAAPTAAKDTSTPAKPQAKATPKKT